LPRHESALDDSTIPDCPSPGIQFRDVTPLVLDPEALRRCVDDIARRYLDGAVPKPDLVVGIEADKRFKVRFRHRL
jgi:adenine/guanine phosphoribosyltransferase-like PRPP-binding protein